MPAENLLKRELRVAFSRRGQPVWFRILKWVIIIGITVLFRRWPYFWWCAAGVLALGFAGHLFWRWKTTRWTQPWGGWNDVETANKPR